MRWWIVAEAWTRPLNYPDASTPTPPHISSVNHTNVRVDADGISCQSAAADLSDSRVAAWSADGQLVNVGAVWRNSHNGITD